MIMRRVITIDIETLPAVEKTNLEAFSPESNKHQDNYLKTALNGDFGKILCIGYVDEDTKGNLKYDALGWDKDNNRFYNDEKRLLIEFWELLRNFQTKTDRIVGHNIFDFDLKFIYKRSVINRVRPTIEFSFARYQSRPIFDTMSEWEKWSYGAKPSLDSLAKIIGLPSSKENGVDGSKIFELYTANQHKLIYDYCLQDAILTRNIYKRMVFAECEPISVTSFSQDLLLKSA